MEKRKKERQKVVAKKRNLESLAKDANRRAEDFERRVSVSECRNEDTASVLAPEARSSCC